MPYISYEFSNQRISRYKIWNGIMLLSIYFEFISVDHRPVLLTSFSVLCVFLLFDKFCSSIKLCKMSAILQFYFFVRALSKEERKIKKKPLKWMACANDTFSTFSNFLGAFAMFVVASKAELLQLKPHPFICMRNFINKKVGNRKTKPIFIISVWKVEC